MEISWLQAIILGIFACLASMPGMGGTVIGNYTLGRPLVGGLVCGIVLGDYSKRYFNWYCNAGCIHSTCYSRWYSFC